MTEKTEKVETYVFDGTEVRLTGRRAEKHLEKPGKPPRLIGTQVEITPIDRDGPTWTKWVDQSSLFKVTNNG